MKDIAALLSSLSNAHGLSGYEDEVAALLTAEIYTNDAGQGTKGVADGRHKRCGDLAQICQE